MARHNKKRIRLADVDMPRRFKDKKEYAKALEALQLRMLRIQQASFHAERRLIVVVEGWDAAGKGGMIRRLTSELDPRGFHVWRIGAPSAEDQGKHYLYRFWQKLPPMGSLAVFDRSWYGRVLVERIEGFIDKPTWQRAYDEINEFEALLVDDGVRIVKLFLHISADEQLRRFEERLQNPYKRWKLTAEDIRNRSRWDAYVEAYEDMFAKTSTKGAPWHVVPGNHKWTARVEALSIIADAFGKGVDVSPPPLDPAVIASAEAALGLKLDLSLTPGGDDARDSS